MFYQRVLSRLKASARNYVMTVNYIPLAKNLLDGVVQEGNAIIDIGPGQCELLNHLYDKWVDKVDLHALDRHESVLDKAPPNTKLIKANLNDLHDYYVGISKLQIPDECFDVVIITELIEHITFPQIFISEISRILKDGGKVIITTPNVHMAGNRLAMLFGRDKFFKNNGAEGFITRGNFDQYGHVCHYTFDGLREVLSPYYDIDIMRGAGFHIPLLRYIQPILTRIFPKLSSNICMVGTKKINTKSIFTYHCPLIEAPQLILHNDRCVAVQVHSKTCNTCKYFHKDFLYRGDKKLKASYIAEYE